MSAEWRKDAKAALGGSAAWFVNAMRTAVSKGHPKQPWHQCLRKGFALCEKGRIGLLQEMLH